LGKFLVECLPRDLDRGEGMSLLKELCSLCSSILTNSNGSKVALQPVAEFVTELVNVHGKSIEARAIEIVNQTQDASTSEDETGKLLEGLVMSLVEASQSVLGAAWAGKHQGQGQQPFESKPSPEPEKAPASMEGLSGIFSILTACVRECPTFLIHLNLPSGAGHQDTLLVGRAVDSASAALTEVEVETVASSLVFLESAVSVLMSNCLPKSTVVSHTPLNRSPSNANRSSFLYPQRTTVSSRE
jgi:hypothetical protein